MKNNLTEAEQRLIEKNQEYWGRRLEKIIYDRESKTVKEIEKELTKLYRSSQRQIKKRVEKLYLEMLEGDGVKLSSLYEKNRLEKLNKEIGKELYQLGKEENKLISGKLEEAYQLCYTDIAGEIGLEFSKLNKEAVKEIIHSAWSGEDFSDRIWSNKDKLIKQLESGIKEVVVLGYSKDKAIKELAKKLETSRYNSTRIVRTETMHVLNEACSNSAKARGYKRKQILAELDERTCTICANHNGEVLPIDAQALPAHPMCRCTYLIVIEDL